MVVDLGKLQTKHRPAWDQHPSAELVARWKINRPDVALGIVVTESVSRLSAINYIRLAQTMHKRDHLIFSESLASVAFSRNWIIQQFLDLPDRVQYLVMLDDDMFVPESLLELLTGRQRPFVSAFTFRRKFPYAPTAQMEIGADADGAPVFGEVLDWAPGEGLRECDVVGTGVICLHRDLLEEMASPWFDFVAYGSRALGEDYNFCRRLHAMGVPVLVDTDVPVGHLADPQIIGVEQWLEVRPSILEQLEASGGIQEIEPVRTRKERSDASTANRVA